jgi:uncharacterized protein (TIGR03435 family)
MNPNRRNIEAVLKNHLRSAPREAMESDAARVLNRLRGQEPSSVYIGELVPMRSRWQRFAIPAAAVALLVVGLLIVLDRQSSIAVIENHDGTHRRIAAGAVVRAEGGTANLSLKDGSAVEMRTNSELSLQPESDGTAIRLNEGSSIIVHAAKQGAGHLYVKTKDATVSVVGTIFVVGAEKEGTRVAVIEGEVSVKQEGGSTKLRPGGLTLTSPFLLPREFQEEFAWSAHATEYVAMLQQAAVPLKFDVASIRPAPYNGGMAGIVPTNKTMNVYHQPVREMILYAYDMERFQLSGGPDWVYNGMMSGPDVYNVVAKADTDSVPTVFQFRQMMQELLVDRFKLVVRHTTKEVPSYDLVVGPKGSKMKEGSPDLEISAANWISGRLASTYEANRVPISSLLLVLKTATGQPVVDKTGLTGTYAFTLHYAELNADPNATAAPSIFTAVQDQLGLKLEPVKRQFDALVIEHVERPTEN